MNRWIMLLSCLLWAPCPALAEDMDPALPRLRIAAGLPGCDRDSGYCPDEALFERLLSELAIAASAPLAAPAHTSGVRGISVGLLHTVTTIDSGALHWRRGTQGGGQAAQAEANPSPDPLLHWTRLQVRKGLPFGLSLGGQVGHGLNTSMWSIAGELRLALVEGFRSGFGLLPDVALAAGAQGVFGAPDVSLFMQHVDVTLSKSYVIEGAWRISPLLCGQVLLVAVDSGFVDLNWGPCDELDCGGNNSGVTRFPWIRQVRLRWAAGAEFAHDAFTFITTAAVEAPSERLAVALPQYAGRRAAVQVAFTAGTAVEF